MPQLLQKPTIAGLWKLITRRLTRAQLHYGHGTDNPRDEAAALICHVFRISGGLTEVTLRRRVQLREQLMLESLAARRIRERIPVVYLTRQCWYAGLPMYVDERVLIPRSPLAELIERQFAPWIGAGRVRRICDMGTGSGCIAVACARYFPRARVDAVDVSSAALAVARINIVRHRLGKRVRPVESDHFNALGRSAYDIIVSNPPYVSRRELAALPAEYRHEPDLALGAGDDGLDSVRVLLRHAPQYLKPGGILVVEVGNTERRVRRTWRQLPFTWLEFERGGGGVFLLTREQLME